MQRFVYTAIGLPALLYVLYVYSAALLTHVYCCTPQGQVSRECNSTYSVLWLGRFALFWTVIVISWVVSFGGLLVGLLLGLTVWWFVSFGLFVCLFVNWILVVCLLDFDRWVVSYLKGRSLFLVEIAVVNSL